MVAVLSDPVERRKYDRTLASHSPVTPPQHHRKRWNSPALWVAAAALVCLGLVLVSRRLPSPAEAEFSDDWEATAAEDVERGAAKERAASPTSRTPVRAGEMETPATGAPRTVERDATNAPAASPAASAALRTLETSGRVARSATATWASSPKMELKMELEPVFPAREPPRVANPPPVLPPADISVAAMLPMPPLRPAARPTVAGDWLFVPSPSKRRPTLYSPEYIEMRVAENDGRLHGRYRARYRVADRAISPTVAFQFEGPALPEGSDLSWAGAGGASGTMQLRLVTGNTVEVVWTADRLGKELGLISGTATLVRRQE